MNEFMMSLKACLHLIKEARQRQFRDSVKFLLSPARMICVQWNSVKLADVLIDEAIVMIAFPPVIQDYRPSVLFSHQIR